MAEKILLGENKHKLSTNEDNFINIELSTSERGFLKSDDNVVIDLYKQYFAEKDKSQNYRLAFTIVPYCSNVLFNVVTEPVYKEGSNECRFINTNAVEIQRDGQFSELYDYHITYKCGGGDSSADTYICESGLVSDTGYSHPKAGAIKYHCGYDIFNNHYFRRKGFAVVNKTNDKAKNFNSIGDTFRNFNGNVVKKKPLIADNWPPPSGTGIYDGEPVPVNLYKKANLRTYFESITNNLTERNGWIGFINKSMLPVENYRKNIINKVMNDCEAGDFIDMYPDRSLFSFVPKYNEYRNRVEPNWDYCITYPFSSSTNNYLVFNDEHNVIGILTKLATEFDDISGLPINTVFKTLIKHNLSEGDYVTLSFISFDGEVSKTEQVRVEAIGVDGDDTGYYFSVKTAKLMNELVKSVGDDYAIKYPKEIRLRRCVNGIECEYYMRYFKKIDTYNSQLNKLAFSQNAFSDQNAQITFTNDINTDGITDNLNRPISELYLTIVKRNRGYFEWYNLAPNNPIIEYSHCFGEVTSGFDLPSDGECTKYNVHKIHNVENGVNGIYESPEALEKEITIENEFFFGDIVEFSISEFKETVLECVNHRFNTSQRETISDRVNDFTFTEIVRDTYDVAEENTFKTYSAAAHFGVEHINVIPEGYYYKPHYKIKIREFGDEVNEGRHIKLTYTSLTESMSSVVELLLAENYYFQAGETPDYATMIYAYKKNRDGYYELAATGFCTEILSTDYRHVKVSFSDVGVDVNEDCILFKHNTEMPDYAYDLKDGSGKYIWRDLMPFSKIPADNELYDSQFTNGAHYHHKNILFYLKRQDPDGEYGIGTIPEKLSTFLIDNVSEDVSAVKYKVDNGTIKC